MIRHRPFGSEHPYATTLDQRVPPDPEAGQHVELRVAAAPAITAIVCHWTIERGEHTDTVELTLTPAAAATDSAHSGGEGHLAAAQASADRTTSRPWTVTTPALDADAVYSYRFTATTETGGHRRTRSYRVAPATWTPEPAAELRLTGPAADRLIPDSTAFRRSADGVDRVRFALRLMPGEHVVGFGERFDHLDQYGRALDTVVFEQYKTQYAIGRTYLPMPFAHVVSATGAWGFHVRSARRARFDIGATQPDQLIVEAALGGTDTEHLEVATSTGTPTDVLNQFLTEVGRAEELPDWVFRLWASGNEWNTQQLVMQRMDTHRDLDIGVGVVVIEAWSDEEGITIFRDATYQVNADGAAHHGVDFTYPADGAWPDPAAMIHELHRRGIKVVLWQIPLQKMRPHPLGQARADADAMIGDGHAVLEADGRPYRNRGWWFPQALMPDLSTQRTRDWWTEKRRYLITDLGVDGFKTDGGEHAWGRDLRYGDGRRGDEGNNLFPVHYAQAFGDLLRSAGKPPVTFSRAGYTGSQAHGAFWAGDENSTWEAFRASITAGLTAAACGIVYWGWDLAGFSGPIPDPELYLRATAAATFMPIMQYHSEFNHHRPPLRDRTPWNIAEQTGTTDVVETFRHWIRIREQLIPYLQQQARLAISSSRPLLRPLFFDHAADPEIWNYPHQYQLGDDLLVNPVTQPGVQTWDTYLPTGMWTDAWTQRPLDGGSIHRKQVTLRSIPLYIRADRQREALPSDTALLVLFD